MKPAITKLIEARKDNAAPTMPSFPCENLPMEMQKPRTQENLGAMIAMNSYDGWAFCTV